MNMNLKLDLDIKKYLPMLRRAQPYVFGTVLVAVFGYTAVTVNSALNVKADSSGVAASPAAKISFDKNTIEAVKKLSVVNSEVPAGSLGKTDPFK